MHERIREIPLLTVLGWLGHDGFTPRKSGTEHSGKCPIHPANKNLNSFSFTSSVWHCFSCGSKGKGAIDLAMVLLNVRFKDAVAWLEAQATTQPIVAVSSPVEPPKTENTPFKGTYEKFYQPCQWLEERVPSEDIRQAFGVGFYHNPSRKSAYSQKVMLPIRRFTDGECVGYLARSISGEEPKYLFPKGFAKHLELYGSWELKSGQSLVQAPGQSDTSPQVPYDTVYLVESPFCVMKFASLGLPAVSPFGWSLSEEQIYMLLQLARGVVYLPDSNKSAESLSVAGKLAKHMWVRCPPLPSEDPEHLSLEQILAL